MMLRRSTTLLLSSVALAGAVSACSNAEDSDHAGAAGDGTVAGSSGNAGGSGTATDGGAGDSGAGLAGSPGPADAQVNELHHPVGPDAKHGREVFRFETFGNEGFWTVALRLPQGMATSGLTIARALELGLNFDIDA